MPRWRHGSVVALRLVLQHYGPVSTSMPRELSAYLAGRVEQRGFRWRLEPWKAAVHDDQPSIELLSRLSESVDRESTRAVVLGELSSGRVLAAFVAAMIWG